MNTSEVLRKAGDVLRERGWSQGKLEGDNRTVCPLGAIMHAQGDRTVWGPAAYLVRDLVAGADNEVATWNDVPGRTAAEVMIALDAAYVVALQEEGTEPGDVL